MDNVQGPPRLPEMSSKNCINCKNVQRDLVLLIKPSQASLIQFYLVKCISKIYNIIKLRVDIEKANL